MTNLNFVNCPECGRQVHDQSPVCPFCHLKISIEDIGDIPFDRHRSVKSKEEREKSMSKKRHCKLTDVVIFEFQSLIGV